MKKFIAVIMMVIMFSMTAEAYTGIHGETYHLGWIDNMYLHKTKSAMYDIGEPTRDAYRWRGNKLYYFTHNGKILRHSTKYIKVKGGEVEFIYTPGTNHNERYSVRYMRYQKRKKDGHWMFVGMQTNIWWMCDMQE
jgi:hypothetical protein